MEVRNVNEHEMGIEGSSVLKNVMGKKSGIPLLTQFSVRPVSL
jgi:hypothetical protein